MWCLFCHMHTTHKLSFDSFVSLAGAATSVIFDRTKVLSWQWQKTRFVAKDCFVVSNGVCLHACGKRLLRKKNVGGIGAHPPTHSHATTLFWVINLEAFYYRKNRQHIFLIVWLTVLQKANMWNTHLPPSDVRACVHANTHTHTHTHMHAHTHTHALYNLFVCVIIVEAVYCLQ